MTQDQTPSLRFPEFRGAWAVKPLGELYVFKPTNSFSRDKLNYENGLVKNIHYGDIHTKFSTLFDIKNEVVPFINASENLDKIKPENYCLEGDIIFADASEDLADVGKNIEIIHLHNQKLLSGLHTILARQKSKELIVGFGGYLFKSNLIRTEIKRQAQGSKVLGISANRISNIGICYPLSLKEQEKITECLSSLDEVITVQGDRLDGLKDYKRGLMQQLFPAKGQTTPTLRFPEFQGKDPWEVKPLNSVLDYGRPDNFFVSSTNYSTEGTPVLTANKSFILGYTKETDGIFKDTPVIIFDDFTTDKKYVDFPFKVKSSAIKILKQKGNDNLKLIFELMNKISLDAKEHKRYYISEYQNLSILLPKPDEQQKIADCLSVMDDLITAQEQIIKTLKHHKNGLMQQLFPKL